MGPDQQEDVFLHRSAATADTGSSNNYGCRCLCNHSVQDQITALLARFPSSLWSLSLPKTQSIGIEAPAGGVKNIQTQGVLCIDWSRPDESIFSAYAARCPIIASRNGFLVEGSWPKSLKRGLKDSDSGSVSASISSMEWDKSMRI